MTSAGLMPMCRPAFSPNFLEISSLVALEMGRRPSMNRLVMRGISSITAPILMPKPRMPGMPSTNSCPFLQANAPMPQPTNTPRKSGSPSRPNFFLHALCVDIQFVKARNQVECLVNQQGERHESLAERLGDGDAVHFVIELLELRSRIGRLAISVRM